MRPRFFVIPIPFRAAVCAIGVFASLSVYSAEIISLTPVGGDSLSPVKIEQDSAEANNIKVTGRGVGVDRTAALKDAYRDAVERAVGIFVDAEQMVKNDNIVKDQILTQSNAYIEKCDIVGESTEDGFVTVRVFARVKRRELTKRITDTMPPQTYKLIDGEDASAHAVMVSEVKRNIDAAALVENFLKDFDPIGQLMRAGLVSKKPKVVVGRSGAATTDLAYLLKLEVDRKRYFEEMVPRLKQILEQVTLTKPKVVRFSDQISMMKLDCAKYLASYKTEYAAERRDDPWYDMNRGSYEGLHALVGSMHGKNTGLKSYVYQWLSYSDAEARTVSTHLSYGCNQNVSGEIYLVTSVAATGAKAILYTVDASIVKLIIDWQLKTRKMTKEYNIVFKDAMGNELGGLPWLFEGERQGNYCNGVGMLLNTGFVDFSWNSCMHWIVTPYVYCWADEFIEWKLFTFKSEDVNKVASVSLELVE